MIHSLNDKELEKELIPFLDGRSIDFINTVVDKLNTCEHSTEFVYWMENSPTYRPACSIMLSTIIRHEENLNDRKRNEIAGICK